MPINRSVFTAPLPIGTASALVCGTCLRGHLSLAKSDLQERQLESSRRAQADDNWEPGWIEGRATGFLHCLSCAEIASFAGRTDVEFWSDEDGQEHIQGRVWPRYIDPAPCFVAVPDACPKAVRKEILSAFPLVWADRSATVNRLRSTIELFMDAENVPRNGVTKKGSVVEWKLHRRILEWNKLNSELGQMLIAAKWLGNEGSHPGEVDVDSMCDTFDLVEYVLAEKYDSVRERLKTRAGQINAVKGSGQTP